MRPLRAALLPPLVATLWARIAAAHLGSVVAVAEFCSPTPPAAVRSDGGLTYSYVPEEADPRYRIAWRDGDSDPTGSFTFYYLDHAPPDALDPRRVSALGTLVRTVDGREARSIYVSCACGADDAGAGTCRPAAMPTCADAGARWCDNYVDWDTSAVASGVYFVAAVNDDPPYYAYNVSLAPVRVTHRGDHGAPVVIVTRPDGIGSAADTTYHASALLVGDRPLELDLDWGVDEISHVEQPLHAIARGLPAVFTPDGTAGYDWDVSGLANAVYFLRVRARDQTGAASFSDSRYGVSVYHRGDAGAADQGAAGDLARPGSRDSGCACSLARRHGPSPGVLAALLPCALGLAAGIRRSRRIARAIVRG